MWGAPTSVNPILAASLWAHVRALDGPILGGPSG